MNALVVFDSTYGNTATLAEAICAGLGDGAQAVRVQDMPPGVRKGLDLLIVGSPTQGGRPTRDTTRYLKSLPREQLRGLRVAAFDTRIAAGEQGFALRSLMRVIGYAAPKIASVLMKQGGTLAAPAEGFIVDGKEGPLRGGEIERAQEWGRLLRRSLPVG